MVDFRRLQFHDSTDSPEPLFPERPEGAEPATMMGNVVYQQIPIIWGGK
jgi:hypothetical protein